MILKIDVLIKKRKEKRQNISFLPRRTGRHDDGLGKWIFGEKKMTETPAHAFKTKSKNNGG